LKRELMDILACPIDKHYPLELVVFEEREEAFERGGRRVAWTEVVNGILRCSACDRWYPIDDEIPALLPDELRRVEEDLAFLRKWSEKIPENILREGKPYNLSQ